MEKGCLLILITLHLKIFSSHPGFASPHRAQVKLGLANVYQPTMSLPTTLFGDSLHLRAPQLIIPTVESDTCCLVRTSPFRLAETDAGFSAMINFRLEGSFQSF